MPRDETLDHQNIDGLTDRRTTDLFFCGQIAHRSISLMNVSQYMKLLQGDAEILDGRRSEVGTDAVPYRWEFEG